MVLNKTPQNMCIDYVKLVGSTWRILFLFLKNYTKHAMNMLNLVKF
jgi:hypothetical protein